MRRRGATALLVLLGVAVGVVLAVPSCRDTDQPLVATTTTTVDRASAWCEIVIDLSVAPDLFSAVEAAPSAVEAEMAFDAGLARLRPLVDRAPADIKSTAQEYVAGFEAYGDLLAAAGYNGSQVDRDALADIVARVGTAQAELEAYALKACG